MNELKFIRESTSSAFKLKVYEGYGYEIEVRRWIKDDSEMTITATPIGDILYQPEIYINEDLKITMSINGIIHADIKDANRIIQAINNVVALSQELNNLIKEL